MLPQHIGKSTGIHSVPFVIEEWYPHLFELEEVLCAVREVEHAFNRVLAHPLLDAVGQFLAIELRFKVFVPVVPATRGEDYLAPVFVRSRK